MGKEAFQHGKRLPVFICQQAHGQLGRGEGGGPVLRTASAIRFGTGKRIGFLDSNDPGKVT